MNQGSRHAVGQRLSAASDPQSIVTAMGIAVHAAEAFIGAVSPNPPVGCVLLDAAGRVLAVEAHQRAGTPHAEVRAIDACEDAGSSSLIDTVVVTLEPCNHQGRTPPCVNALLATPARRIVIGSADPNPAVAGGGAARLAFDGREVVFIRDVDDSGARGQAASCARLIAPFAKWSTTGRPWLTVKTALSRQGSMLPPPGRKTFTSPTSLALAHRLRRRADAIVTGSGTVLSDRPLFTVRHVADHADKRRLLVILDRRGRVDEGYVAEATARGFDVIRVRTLEEAMDRSGAAGVVEMLLEAGPTLTQAVLAGTCWDEHVVIRQALHADEDDEVCTSLRLHEPHERPAARGTSTTGAHPCSPE